jgi:ribosomal protein L7/L12
MEEKLQNIKKMEKLATLALDEAKKLKDQSDACYELFDTLSLNIAVEKLEIGLGVPNHLYTFAKLIQENKRSV